MHFYEVVTHDLPSAIRVRGDLGILLQWELWVAIIVVFIWYWPLSTLWDKEIPDDENKGWNDPRFLAVMYLAITIGAFIVAGVLVGGVTVE